MVVHALELLVDDCKEGKMTTLGVFLRIVAPSMGLVERPTKK